MSAYDSLTRNKVPRDPEISPIYASDAQLRSLPPTYFIVSRFHQLQVL